MENGLLGGLTPSQFLRRYWQKTPCFVSRAIPGFHGVLSVDALFDLAACDDVESRLVVRERDRWSLRHGPFTKSDRRDWPTRNWSLLVHGVNLHLAEGDALLRRFDFIPYARLDDLMVSYAAPGGGVGPHVDSYDVFLLQGAGRRRWRISRQRDLALVPELPLKILARFRPQREWLLGPGDMLYLPPLVAHEGTAVDACMTYSIGFRAPAAQELAIAFLDWLQDRVALDGRYVDPGLAASKREPACIGASLRRYAVATISRLPWDERDAARFLGCYLTEPKPAVQFERPHRPRDEKAFKLAAMRSGLRLDRRTQLLYDARNLFINGDVMAWPARAAGTLKKLANERRLGGAELRRSAPLKVLYRWYRDGFVHLD